MWKAHLKGKQRRTSAQNLLCTEQNLHKAVLIEDLFLAQGVWINEKNIFRAPKHYKRWNIEDFSTVFSSFRAWTRNSFCIYIVNVGEKARLIVAIPGFVVNKIYIFSSSQSSDSVAGDTLRSNSHRPMNTSELRVKTTFEAWTTRIFHIPNHKARWTGEHMAAVEFLSLRGEFY